MNNKNNKQTLRAIPALLDAPSEPPTVTQQKKIATQLTSTNDLKNKLKSN